jgi:hypothetical protein
MAERPSKFPSPSVCYHMRQLLLHTVSRVLLLEATYIIQDARRTALLLDLPNAKQD